MAKAVVIGGGPAGSVAALLLARAGYAVDIFEQHSFPRDKVCGECLSGLGVDVLERAGVADKLHAVHPARLRRSLLHPIDRPSIEVPLPRESMGISRLKMDALLVQAAWDAGVCVHQPARCESIVPGDLPTVRWRDLHTNLTRETTADWIVVADGKGALLQRKTWATGDLGIKTHFTEVDGSDDAIELFAGRGNYGGLAAVEDGRWNAAFSVPASLVRNYAGDFQALFDGIVRGNAVLQQRLETAKRCGPWLAAPLPRFAVSGGWAPRIIPVGNAAAALEPVGGEGMGLALRSAELAVSAIVTTQRSGNFRPVRNLPREYNKLWQVRRIMCRGIGMMFSSEQFGDAVAPLMAVNPHIPAAFMRLAGKGR